MKWLKRILLVLLMLPVLAVAAIYVRSEMILAKKYPPEPYSITLSTDPDVIAEGERLAQVTGCFHGCHGADMQGDIFFEEQWVGRFVAPNLTTAMVRYTPTELEAIIRQGIRPDGTSVLGMPSDAFSVMHDEDLVAILSFIARHPKNDLDLGASELGPLARLGLAMGQYFPAVIGIEKLAAQQKPVSTEAPTGRYLATITCSECHGLQLEGQEGFTPPLLIAKAYSIDDFRKLMSTGVGLGDRDLGLMTQVAQSRFKHMTDDEVESLHAYLQSL
jgi:mono/diheme cytochrome c family protein